MISTFTSSRCQGNESNHPSSSKQRRDREPFVINPVFPDSRIPNAIVGTEVRANLVKWQSPPDPSINHSIESGRQLFGTAKWFLEEDMFNGWKVSDSLMWIHGKRIFCLPFTTPVNSRIIPFSSGFREKCALVRLQSVSAILENSSSSGSSAIINDIAAMCEAGSASMAYFYFDSRDLKKQSSYDLLSSLLVQLSARSDLFCDILLRVYVALDHGKRIPSEDTLKQCLKEMLRLPGHGPVYIIIDALNECPNSFNIPSPRDEALQLIKELVDLHLPNLRLCVTSRPEVDIRAVFESLASHGISLHDQIGQQRDIAHYVRSVVYYSSSAMGWSEADEQHIIETLSERANGM